jgi:hypothetical protein
MRQELPAQQPALHGVIHAADETRMVQTPVINNSISTSISTSISVTGWIARERYEGQQQLRGGTNDDKLVLCRHVREHVSQPPPQDQLSRQFQQQQQNLHNLIRSLEQAELLSLCRIEREKTNAVLESVK